MLSSGNNIGKTHDFMLLSTGFSHQSLSNSQKTITSHRQLEMNTDTIKTAKHYNFNLISGLGFFNAFTVVSKTA